MTTRRTILKTMSAAAGLSLWGSPLRFAFAAVPTDRRLVMIILRGAVDGLAAVPPHGDKDYSAVRGQLALSTEGAAPLHDLDGLFGLHPALANLKSMYDTRELIVFQNIGTPYRDRSHFDGQNVLETGGIKPHLFNDGWLNRALEPLALADGVHALAVAQTPPLMLSGEARCTSWMPANMQAPDDRFMAQVRMLYAKDQMLAQSLDSAMQLQSMAMIASDDPSDRRPGANAANLAPLFTGAGRLLAAADGPRVAVMEVSGWDTHINEGASEGALARRLQALDQGVEALKTAMGASWQNTAVIMATEFGRTVKPNGSGGTDHGTGGASFLLGGAVNGGRVQAQWTGLAPSQLQDGRDQPVTTDLRSLFKGVLADHMGLSTAVLEQRIFPDSAGAAAMKGLLRA